jgi:hypothetical protein
MRYLESRKILTRNHRARWAGVALGALLIRFRWRTQLEVPRNFQKKKKSVDQVQLSCYLCYSASPGGKLLEERKTCYYLNLNFADQAIRTTYIQSQTPSAA